MSDSASSGSAPPTSTSAAPDLAESGPRWHVIVGALGLVYGVAGILMHAMFFVSMIFWKQMMAMAGMGEIEMPPALMVQGAVQSGLLLALGIVLAVGSLLVIMRRPFGATLMRFWAGARLVLVLIGLLLGVVFMQAQTDFQIDMAERQREIILDQGGDPNVVPVPDRATIEQRAHWTAGGMALVLAGFPIFVGVLLTSRRKRDDIAAWPARL